MFDQDAQTQKNAYANFSQPTGAAAGEACIQGLSSLGAISFRARHGSYNADGFTVELQTLPSGAFRIASLVLKVTNGFAGFFTKPTGSAPQSQSDTVGFRSSALMLCAAQKTHVETTRGVRLGISARDTSGRVSATAIQEKWANSSLTSNVHCYDSKDGFDVADNDTPVVDSIAALSVSSTAITARWTTNSANATLVGYFAIGGGTAPPSGWLLINEPTIGLTDRSSYLHIGGGGSDHSFSLQLRQRGQASISLRIASGDTYQPTIGTLIYLYDQTSLGATLVFAGTIDRLEDKWFGNDGDQFITITAVSLEQVFDTIMVPPLLYTNQTAGYIFNDLLTLAAGSQVSAGTISTGPTIARLNITDYPKISEIFSNLATQAGFVWGVDPGTQQVYFRAQSAQAAPFTVTNQIWETLGFTPSRQDYRNRQAIRISTGAFPQSSELFVGAGQKTFTLLRACSEVTNAWITTNTQNTATGTFTGQPSANDTITFKFPVSGSTYNWAAASPYVLGQIIIDSNGNIQRCTTAGTSGGVQPTWSTVLNATTTDNTAVWTNAGVGGLSSTNDTVYTFVTSLDNTLFGQVLIGSSNNATIQNLIDAINAKASQAGLTFSLPTWENPLVNADARIGLTFKVRNKAAGSGYVAALSESTTNFTWGSTTTNGGTTVFGTTTMSVGVLGTTTAGLVYTPGSTAISIATPLNVGSSLQIQYVRADAGVIQVENTALVTSRAAIEHGTGKYQQITDDSEQASLAAGLLEAQQALAAYSVIPQEIEFQTYLPGLFPGQYLTIAITTPANAATQLNGSYVIQEITGELVPCYPYMETNDPVTVGYGHYRYTVKIINVNQIGSYLEFWEGLGGGASGASASTGILAAGPTDGGSAGTVTSIFLTAPVEFSVGGSPITTSGTLALTWATEAANKVFAGPSSGGVATPTFRSLVAADINGLAPTFAVTTIYSGSLATTSELLGAQTTVGGQASTANLVPDIILSPFKYDNTVGGNTLNKFAFYNSPGSAAYGIGMSASNGFGLFSGDRGFTFSTGVTNIDGTGATSRMTLSLAGALSVPLSISTLDLTLGAVPILPAQTANKVFAGPSSGGAAVPTFRSLVAADINGLAPTFAATTIYSGSLATTSELLGAQTTVGGQSSTANLVPDIILSPYKYDNTAGGNTLNKFVFYNSPGAAAYGIGMSVTNGFGLFSGDRGFTFSTGVTNIDGTGATSRMTLSLAGALSVPLSISTLNFYSGVNVGLTVTVLPTFLTMVFSGGILIGRT